MEKCKFSKQNQKKITVLIQSNKKKYYTYGLLRPDGIIFYIGKGTNGRIFSHEKETGDSIKNHIINKIKQNNQQIYYHIFEFFHSEKKAYQLEINLIDQYGSIKSGGILSNITKGGEGWKGGTHSKQTIDKLRKKLIIMRNTPEYKKKRSKIAKQLCQNPKHRIKIKKGVEKYYKENPQEVEKHKIKQKDAMQTDQMKQKMSEIMKKYYKETPGAIEKNRAAVKKYYKETPGAIEKNRAAVKKGMDNPDVRKKLSESTIKRFKKMKPGEWSKKQKQIFDNPEIKRKMSESAKKRIIKKICKICHSTYFKKAINKFNKDLCDDCRKKINKK